MRSHLAVAAALAVASLTLSACAGQAPVDAGADVGAGDCGAVEEQPDQGHQHLLGDAEPPVDYLTTPPTSGWHYREKARAEDALTVHGPEDPLSEAEQVTVLSVDAVVVAYHGLADAEREAVESLVEERYDGRVAVTPYASLGPGEVALTAWSTMQRCEGVDLDTVAGFIDEHATAEPDYTVDGEADHRH